MSKGKVSLKRAKAESISELVRKESEAKLRGDIAAEDRAEAALNNAVSKAIKETVPTAKAPKAPKAPKDTPEAPIPVAPALDAAIKAQAAREAAKAAMDVAKAEAAKAKAALDAAKVKRAEAAAKIKADREAAAKAIKDAREAAKAIRAEAKVAKEAERAAKKAAREAAKAPTRESNLRELEPVFMSSKRHKWLVEERKRAASLIVGRPVAHPDMVSWGEITSASDEAIESGVAYLEKTAALDLEVYPDDPNIGILRLGATPWHAEETIAAYEGDVVPALATLPLEAAGKDAKSAVVALYKAYPALRPGATPDTEKKPKRAGIKLKK